MFALGGHFFLGPLPPGGDNLDEYCVRISSLICIIPIAAAHSILCDAQR
jgi:hypothetical protein